MKENINLVEILENCPKGTKFYSTIFGDVEFNNIDNDYEYPIVIITNKRQKIKRLSSEGKLLTYYEGECTLFPSKDKRDWSKFTAPWYKKEKDLSKDNERAWLYLVSDVLTWKDGIGQYLDDPRVQELAKKLCSEYAQKLYNTSNTGKIERKFKVGDWIVDYYCRGRVVELTDDAYMLDTGQGIPFSCENNAHLWTIQDAKDGDVLATSTGVFIYNNTSILQAYCYYSNERNRFIIEDRGYHCPWNMQEVKPATKEQHDTLMKSMSDAGYEWDAEKKELKKLVVFGCKVPNRFDPKTLNEFDKVLVKEDGDCIWRVDIISVPAKYNDNIPYIIGDNDFDWIIPYNEDTKYLMGTTEEAPEFYRYWED